MDKDIHQLVTDSIIASLEAMKDGRWTKPWADTFIQGNASTGAAYNGVNVWLLAWAAFSGGHDLSLWVTYKQAQALAKKHGGNGVTRGQKGTTVTFWKTYNKVQKDEGGKVVLGDDGKPMIRRVFMLRHFTVFNVAQTGLPAVAYEKYVPKKNGDLATNEALEGTLGALGVQVGGGDMAAYMKSSDLIMMPPKFSFSSTEGYYATLAHEHIHATGHESRCDRDLGQRFGQEAYAMEELVAEMGAAFLCAEFDVRGQGLQHPEYISHWLKVLGGDKKAIFTAASKAKEAVRFIHAAAAPEEEAEAA